MRPAGQGLCTPDVGLVGHVPTDWRWYEQDRESSHIHFRETFFFYISIMQQIDFISPAWCRNVTSYSYEISRPLQKIIILIEFIFVLFGAETIARNKNVTWKHHDFKMLRWITLLGIKQIFLKTLSRSLNVADAMMKEIKVLSAILHTNKIMNKLN